jgi:hypothetical protein
VQKGVTDEGVATIVLLTHQVQESQLQAALSDIRQQKTTKDIPVILRVLS